MVLITLSAMIYCNNNIILSDKVLLGLGSFLVSSCHLSKSWKGEKIWKKKKKPLYFV